MDIIHILKTELSTLNELLEVLKREKEVLIKEDGNKLTKIIHEKLNIMEKLDKIEKDRVDIMKDKTVDDLMEEKKNEVLNIKNSIKNTVKSIEELQETNRLLTKQSLDYTQKMIDVFKKGQKKSHNTYGKKGKIDDNNNASMINKSI